MVKGANNRVQATSGYVGRSRNATKIKGGSKSLQKNYNPQSYERTSKIKNEDKISGGYERYTGKEKVSFGERHVERGSRQVGVRNEFKKSSTMKVGNKSGYTEIYCEERVRDVDFNNNYASNNNRLTNDGHKNYSDGYNSDDNDSVGNNSSGDDSGGNDSGGDDSSGEDSSGDYSSGEDSRCNDSGDDDDSGDDNSSGNDSSDDYSDGYDSDDY